MQMGKLGLGLILLLGIVGHVACELGQASEMATPSAPAVYEEICSVLSANDWDKFLGYVDRLEQDYPGYVPTRLARIVAEYVDGDQSEVVIERLTQLQQELKPLLPLVSPRFEEQLQATIQRHEGLLQAFEAAGVTRDQRKARFSVHRISIVDAGQDFKFLFLLAPEIFLPVSEGQVDTWLAKPGKHASTDGASWQKATEVLKKPANALSRGEQRDAIAQLGYAGTEQALAALCDLLVGPDDLAASRAAEAISGYGETGVPKLLDLLKRRDLLDSKKRPIIWALVRTGSTDTAVLQAIRNQGASRFLLREYAERALSFLEPPAAK
ncbi:MAG: hypothetical protein HY706_21705 [Candidatus Hydrogenedentes bacterium]|nr:hypothetical protein [Candidatus Hydrogenedentota bacterium]